MGQAVAVPNFWHRPEHAREYLGRADRLPHRSEGEGVLAADLSGCLPGRLLDLGCGDGRLTELLLAAYPGTTAVCVDLSDTMLAAATGRLGGTATLIRHDLADPLPSGVREAGPFGAIVSSFALHHLDDPRKRSLYAEVAGVLAPDGVLANLDIVASPTPALHHQWRDEMGAVDDPSDILCDLFTQLTWLREAGLCDVDCIWKWRSLSLMRGRRP
jgi:tRNA (cmo5U34)-methyltransferase